MIKQYDYIDISKQNINLHGKQVIIWGRSISGLHLYIKLKKAGADIIGFTDSYAIQDEIFMSRKVICLDELYKYNAFIFVSTQDKNNLIDILELIEKIEIGNSKIVTQLSVWGPYKYDTEEMKSRHEKEAEKIREVFNKLYDQESKKVFQNLLKYQETNRIELLRESYEMGHEQYFPTDFLHKCEDEVFIDAGAYDGSTSLEFIDWIGGEYEHIYMMEPDIMMKRVCDEVVRLKNMKDVSVYGKGAYSERCILNFISDFETGSSSISNVGEMKIETISIDEMLLGNRATYIKMDIEGAEKQALIGCKKTIERYRPKLAICIYHEPSDLWEIPYYILSKYPFYKLYIRHYTDITTETVLYAE